MSAVMMRRQYASPETRSHYRTCYKNAANRSLRDLPVGLCSLPFPPSRVRLKSFTRVLARGLYASASLFAAYCIRAVFACFCEYAADRTFVLADLGTGADALADTSTEAFADALAATWARAYPSADPGVIAVVLRW